MFPHVRVRGDARDRGRQYGQQAADRIARSIAAYREVFAHYARWDWDRVTAEAGRFVEPIERFGPSYLAELRGIAEGAGVPEEDVLAINVRTEVMFAAKARDAAARLPRVAECSSFASVASDGRTLVGQNWDWLPHAVDTVVVLEAEQDDGPSFVTVVEAGLLAKLGMNEHGLGVATNALVSDADRGEPGVPYHVLLRALLDARTPAQALATLQQAPRSSSANYLIAHGSGLALDVEATPGELTGLHLIDPDADGRILHTNHFRAPSFTGTDVGRWLMPDSVFRLQRLERETRCRSGLDSGLAFEKVATDHAGHPAGVCTHPDEADDPLDQGVTVVGAVMDLTGMRMRLADGNPCATGFRDVDLGWLTGRS